MRQARQILYLFRRIPAQHLMMDLAVMAASLFVSLWLRTGAREFHDYIRTALLILPIVLALRILCLVGFRCYLIMWRYVSTMDAVRLLKALGLSTLLVIAVTFLFPNTFGRLPRSVYFIDWFVTTILMMGARLARRLQYERGDAKTDSEGKRTLIYGAGHNGRLLAQRFRSDSALITELVGFIDDDPKKKDVVIHGVPVLGSRAELANILEEYRISQFIVAIPNLSQEALREVVQITRPFNIRPRTISQISDDTKKNVEIYREIELSDLLNRPKREIDLKSIRHMIKGHTVMVTGAGGSIGSELSRQILSHEPSRLILLDHSEYNLYEIDKELRLSTQCTQKVVPLLVDLKDRETLATAMKQYSPELVFHAAAYKHVHLVESNPHSAILNNVLGTQNLLDLSEEIRVRTFVLISTDKAVNPAGVMGATKRICELLTTIKAVRTGQSYCSVRFGNVLGSSGSLIPLLRKQIEEGGPITITHRDMTRFFMLIPEAVCLVLKAATIATPGDINVLKMGEPVKILDVATSLIALCGKSEDEISIVFTGLRPGEKMFEELYIRGDELKTEHPDILTLPFGDSTLRKHSDEGQHILSMIGQMIDRAKESSNEALFTLNEIVKSKYLTAGLRPVPSVRTEMAEEEPRQKFEN